MHAAYAYACQPVRVCECASVFTYTRSLSLSRSLTQSLFRLQCCSLLRKKEKVQLLRHAIMDIIVMEQGIVCRAQLASSAAKNKVLILTFPQVYHAYMHAAYPKSLSICLKKHT